MKLYTEAQPNQSQSGTRGYIGRLEIRTADNFGITVTLDQHDGLLDELYVDYLDLEERGTGLCLSNGKNSLTSVPRCNDLRYPPRAVVLPDVLYQ